MCLSPHDAFPCSMAAYKSLKPSSYVSAHSNLVKNCRSESVFFMFAGIADLPTCIHTPTDRINGHYCIADDVLDQFKMQQRLLDVASFSDEQRGIPKSVFLTFAQAPVDWVPIKVLLYMYFLD